MTPRVNEPRRKRPRPYKFVQSMIDRHGKWRHYLRRPGFPLVALPGIYGSEEFAAAYAAATSGNAVVLPREIGADRTVTRGLGHLIVLYKQSEAWNKLAKSSQRPRVVPLEKLRSGDWGRILVTSLKSKHIRDILATEVKAAHTRRHWLKMLRGLFEFAISIDWIADNPTLGVKVKVPKSEGFWTWQAEEIAQYRAYYPLGTQERLVFEFALETGSRRCEVVHCGRQHVKPGVDEQGQPIRRIYIKRAKGSKDVNVPLTPELAAAIDAMPPNGALTYLTAPRGAPFSTANLGARFAKWADAAGLPKHCRLHGLKKAILTEIAGADASAFQLMGVSGHKSLAEAQRYTTQFNRQKAADAAMALLLKARTKAVKPDLPGLQSA